MSTTTYTMTCLSPVHVGTGFKYDRFTASFHDGTWSVVDLERVLAKVADAEEIVRAMKQPTFTWASLLKERGIEPTDVSLYTLRCPEDPGAAAVSEAIKDSDMRPYVPGTSLKGAMRTALLYHLIRRNHQHIDLVKCYLLVGLKREEILRSLGRPPDFRPEVLRQALARIFGLAPEQAHEWAERLYRLLGADRNRLHEQRESERLERALSRFGDKKEWVGQAIERAVMGKNPNYDLLRALQVGDTHAVAAERLAVGLVWTHTLRNGRLVEKREPDGEYKSYVEWLPPDTTTTTWVRVDDFLFSRTAGPSGHAGEREQALRTLAAVCNTWARALINAEKAFYSKHGPAASLDFYMELEARVDRLPEGAFVLNLGWGGGWPAKAIGEVLRLALGQQEFEALRRRYGLGVNPRSRQLTWPFPKTRRLAHLSGGRAWPLGWVQLVPQST